MRIMNKSNSMPVLSHQILEKGKGKPAKHKLQDLENEVNKSRIAIENMSHTRAIESSLYNRVEELQKDLHRSILSLNTESEKQKVLAELTTILKGEMSAVQAVQKSSEEFVSCGIEKKKKKVEYDTKQILHKFNEEIAKINLLKEQANASRDERVVYSNLFNKIEKEIKHYQEIYKQTLIKNEIFLDKKRVHAMKNHQEIAENDFEDESVDKFLKIEFEEGASSIKDIKAKELSRSVKQIEKSQDSGLFLTNPKEFQTKISGHFNNTFPREPSSTPLKHVSQSQGIEAIIKEREATIEAIVVHAQCRSLDEVMKLFTAVDLQNEHLVKEVSHLDEDIGQAEEAIDTLMRQKRSSQVYQNRQLTEIVNISKKSRSNKNAIGDVPSSQPEHLQNLTRQICEVLGVECENLGDDVLKEIDGKIDRLGCTVIKKHNRRESHMVTGEDMCDRGVCELLDKIERFGESEKIFDQNMLRAEYHKQLNKVRKRGKRSS